MDISHTAFGNVAETLGHDSELNLAEVGFPFS